MPIAESQSESPRLPQKSAGTEVSTETTAAGMILTMNMEHKLSLVQAAVASSGIASAARLHRPGYTSWRRPAILDAFHNKQGIKRARTPAE